MQPGWMDGSRLNDARGFVVSYIQEVTKEEKDENGVTQKVSVLEYQYEQEMEPVGR